MRPLLFLLALLIVSPAAARQPRWPTFTSPKKDFSVSAPGSLKGQLQPEKTTGALETLVYQYVDFQVGRTYIVVRTTLNAAAPNDQAAETLMTSMVNTVEANVYRVLNKEVIKDKPYKREISYLLSQGMHFRSRFYLKDNYMYTVSVSTKEERGLDDEYSKKFLDSFKLLEAKK